MKNLRITTRLEQSERKRIEQLISDGRFKNISEVIRTALHEFLQG